MREYFAYRLKSVLFVTEDAAVLSLKAGVNQDLSAFAFPSLVNATKAGKNVYSQRCFLF